MPHRMPLRMPNSMTTVIGAAASPASSTAPAGESGALETGFAAHSSAAAPAPSGATRDAAQDAAQDAEQHDMPGQATAVAAAMARDGSDAVAFVQCTLTNLVVRMVDYAGLSGPPCGGADFGQTVPLSGSDLRRAPRGPHPTCRAWQRGIGKGRGGSNTANLTHRCSRRVVHALPHALSPASRFSCYLRRRDSNVPSSTTTSLRQQNAWTQRRGM